MSQRRYITSSLSHNHTITQSHNHTITQSHTQLKDSLNPLATALENAPNLLLKGNNLIALHSLKKLYAGKVKLIYIDPPYNTGNDSFTYNDNFNHSSWLTFMKNRLEVAREFLTDDGVIFIQCDDNEQAYLKVLCDEIFGRENFVSCSVVCVNPKGRQSDKFFPTTHDYILSYAKNSDGFLLNGLKLTEEQKKEYNKRDENGIYREQGLRLRGGRATAELSPTLHFPIYYNIKENIITLDKDKDKDKNVMEIIPKFSNGELGTWRWSKDKILKDKDLLLVRKVSNERYDIFEKDYLTSNKTRKQKSLWLDKDFSNEVGGLHIKNIFNLKVFSYPKSEFLLQRIIEIATNENDLVMDFFAGSGTTLAVAHKMKRRYIGIEQMEYVESITKERLKKVINGEQGGISKQVEWSGGGAFIYAELMPLNAVYKEKLDRAESDGELENIYKDMQEKAFLDYRFEVKKALKDREFNDLPLEQKKEILKLILDSNMDYVPYFDIKDSNYKLDKETLEYNKIFYKDND